MPFFAGSMRLTMGTGRTTCSSCCQRATAASGTGSGNIYIYVTSLRFKLSGRRVLSARFNVETAGFERERPEI